jgi:predicted nucleic acid-binding protein
VSVTIELEPAVETALRKRAEYAGVSLEKYLRAVLERDLESSALDSRVQASVRLAEALRGKVGEVPSGILDGELLYGSSAASIFHGATKILTWNERDFERFRPYGLIPMTS